jgi:amino acid permease
MDSLKFSSMIGTLGVAYIAVVVCIFAAGAIPLPPPEQTVSVWPPPRTRYTKTSGMVESFAIFIGLVSCCENLPTLVLELRDRTLRRVDTLIVISMAICAGLYAVVGFCGSYAFGAVVEGDFLKSLPIEHSVAGGQLSMFARVAFVVNVMGGIPLYLHPLRVVVSQMVFGIGPQDLKAPARISLTFALFLSSLGVAILVPNLDDVFAFLGSTADMSLGFALPALFYFLSVRSKNGESFGAHSQDPEGGVTGSLGLRHLTYWRVPSLVMAIVSFGLIPVLLAGLAYLHS